MSLNPFTFHPGYQALAHLPLAERLAQLRRDDVRERILSEQASTQGPANQRALRRCRCGAVLCCAVHWRCPVRLDRPESRRRSFTWDPTCLFFINSVKFLKI